MDNNIFKLMGVSELVLISDTNTNTTYNVGEYKMVVLVLGLYSNSFSDSYVKITGGEELKAELLQYDSNPNCCTIYRIWRIDKKDATICAYTTLNAGVVVGARLYGIK